jgi:hypothetical protein
LKLFGQELQKLVVGGFTRLFLYSFLAVSPPIIFCSTCKVYH